MEYSFSDDAETDENRRDKKKVLLREPEMCMECSEVFISLYPLRRCADHASIERA
ncbi:MAG: hypothetical protein HY887_08395 [Deltaproteobacteria bacterium]|nr:hypothetical protein [Deltaproteobacteria bacterium]